MKIWIKKNAFTLIEVLVAMMVLAIGLLGLAGITVVVLRSNTLSQQISEATNLASSLMEDLRRQSSLPNCDYATNALTSVASNCEILVESGINAIVESGERVFLPPSTRTSTACAVANVLASGVTETFDAIAGNSVSRASVSAADLCSLTQAPAGTPYIRYYRSYLPSGTGVPATERRIVTVVLWQDKFGKWRQVHLDTRRSGN